MLCVACLSILTSPSFPTDGPLPLSSLRLLVPPLRLMSAVMWQVVGRRSLEHYGKLEDFVCLVTETVPELLTDRQRALLLLGLRAKVCAFLPAVTYTVFSMCCKSEVHLCCKVLHSVVILNGLPDRSVLQMSQEWIVEDVAPELIQTHLDRIQSICLTKVRERAHGNWILTACLLLNV